MKKIFILSVTTCIIFLISCSKTQDTTVPPTLKAIPTLTTDTASSITTTTALTGGYITSDGGAEVTTRGVVWSTSSNPTISLATKTTDGSGLGVFTSNIAGLTDNTTYYVRAYATNSIGTAYGTQITFLTKSKPDPLASVTICNQVWMTKNLDVATYRNGDTIPKVTDPNQWANLTTGAWCWYNNDSATYGSVYGKLYNWYAVNDSRMLAPQGWHVASDSEWTVLSTCLGGETIAGGKIKETGSKLWLTPNLDATNSSGFTAIPGGYRYHQTGQFNYVGWYSYFWTSTKQNLSNAWARGLDYNSGYLTGFAPYFSHGISVRCVKD